MRINKGKNITENNVYLYIIIIYFEIYQNDEYLWNQFSLKNKTNSIRANNEHTKVIKKNT